MNLTHRKSYRRHRALFGVFLLLLFAALWHWLSPGDRLARGEIDDYLRRIDEGLLMAATDREEFVARLRSWAEADDGRPVHMLNLIRFHDGALEIPGHPEFDGTAEEANAHYERTLLPLLAARGIYPVFASSVQGVGAGAEGRSNLLGFEPGLDGWDRVLLVRYPSRRAFLDMASDPEYLAVAPFKLAAIDLGFVPLEKQYQLPDPRWILAILGLVAVLFAAALRRRETPERRAR